MIRKSSLFAIGIMSVEQIIRMISGLILLTLFAATLPMDMLGLYILIQSIILITGSVIRWGLDQIVLRDVSKQDAQKSSFI